MRGGKMSTHQSQEEKSIYNLVTDFCQDHPWTAIFLAGIALVVIKQFPVS